MEPDPNQWLQWQQQQLLAAPQQPAQQPLMTHQFMVQPQQQAGQQPFMAHNFMQQPMPPMYQQQLMPQQLMPQQQMLQHHVPFPFAMMMQQPMLPLNSELYPMGLMPRKEEKQDKVSKHMMMKTIENKKCEDEENETCRKKYDLKKDGIKICEENDEKDTEEATETATVACATAFKSLQSKKAKKKQSDEESEDFQSVKAFAESLKSKRKSSNQKTKVESSSDSDEERMKRRKKSHYHRKVMYVDDSDEEEEEEDEDESEDEWEDRTSKKKPATYVKGRKPASRGRKKGSVNVQPKKDVIKAQLAAAMKKIKELEKAKKGACSSRNSDPSSSRMKFIYQDENTGIIAVPADEHDDSACELETTEPPSYGAAAVSIPPDDDDEVWQVPPDFGWLDCDEQEKEIPYAPVQTVTPESEPAETPKCKACLVESPTHILNPCSHVGVCDSCKEVYHFSSELRCPGCGVKHLIMCKKFY